MCYFDHILYKRTKKTAFILKIIIPLTVIGYLFLFIFTPRSYIHKKHELITIKQGNSLREITYRLYRKKLITNPYLFYFIGFISGYSEYIEAGTYYVSASQSPVSIYHEFVNGRIASVKVTVPPGLNIFQIAKILAKNRITGKKLFLKECFNRKLLLSIGIDERNVEGFLYPNTYIFKIDSNPVKIIKEMVTEFNIKTKNLKLGYKNLIIASIITKEANENSKKNMR
ncbi:MAG TPA: hypothetical protein ENI54_02970, partial [bacterium]|nr:hypothetical protein [bacterium]